MSVPAIRRGNLGYLVTVHGSQAGLAGAIIPSGLTQPIISTILRKKRPLRPLEARAIERQLGIPQTWLDRFDLRQAWKLTSKFRELPLETQALFNDMLEFAEGRNEAKK